MHTMLDMPELDVRGYELPPEEGCTTIGNAAYEGFWAASVAVGMVVEVDRMDDNPINREDPWGLAAVSANIEAWGGVHINTLVNYSESYLGTHEVDDNWDPSWGISLSVTAGIKANGELEEAPAIAHITKGSQADVGRSDHFTKWKEKGVPPIEANLYASKDGGHCVEVESYWQLFTVKADPQVNPLLIDTLTEMIPGPEGKLAEAAVEGLKVVGPEVIKGLLESEPQDVIAYIRIASEGTRAVGVYNLDEDSTTDQFSEQDRAHGIPYLNNHYHFGSWVHTNVPTPTETNIIHAGYWESYDS